ncbi:uncharacterized protein LOC123309725 [Coccinella septempunctata]|uniref:uncharacterized protein LOC123309725 n=1 Tax=Coccinella septempunctata TaxID=41139 RepID=UPI001D06815B|nr:uncharacterized protein LOC123309725 [Coccinella septempunctata]
MSEVDHIFLEVEVGNELLCPVKTNLSLEISKMSCWETFILPTKIALSTVEKLEYCQEDDLQKLVVIENLMKQNESVQRRVEDIRYYASTESKNIIDSNEKLAILTKKVNNARIINQILENTARGTKSKKSSDMEIAKLCGINRMKRNNRYCKFKQPPSPLAVHANKHLHRGIKRKRNE